MDIGEFTGLVVSLCKYYERKRPDRDSMELWFSRVAKLPNEVVPWMKKTIAERYELFPRNLPNVMYQLWNEWLNEHPEKFAGDDRIGRCSDPWCREHGDGLLHVWKRGDDGLVRIYAFRCKTCGGNGHNYPAATAGELQEKGYLLDTNESAMERKKPPKLRDVIRKEISALMGKAKSTIEVMTHGQ